MSTSDTIASLSAVLAAGSLGVAFAALRASGKATDISKDIARRQGVTELHMAWKDVNDIDPSKLVGPDVRNAINALSLTATIWNHDVIEKEILLQSYWDTFKNLYDILYSCREIVPGYKKTANDLITAEITKAYVDMKEESMKKVKQTRMGE